MFKHITVKKKLSVFIVALIIISFATGTYFSYDRGYAHGYIQGLAQAGGTPTIDGTEGISNMPWVNATAVNVEEFYLNSEDKTDLFGYPEQGTSYVIFKEDSTIYSKNGATGQIDYSGTNASIIIQNTINILSNGGKIVIKEGVYSVSSQYITVSSGIEIFGSGFNTILKPQSLGGAGMFTNVFRITGSNVKISNLYFSGTDIFAADTPVTNTNGELYHIWVEDTLALQNIMLENLMFDACWYGIALHNVSNVICSEIYVLDGTGPNGNGSQGGINFRGAKVYDGIVKDSIFKVCDTGLRIPSSRRILVSNCFFYYSGGVEISNEAYHESRTIKIKGCTFIDATLNLVLFNNQYYVTLPDGTKSGIDDIDIEGNTFEWDDHAGVSMIVAQSSGNEDHSMAVTRVKIRGNAFYHITALNCPYAIRAMSVYGFASHWEIVDNLLLDLGSSGIDGIRLSDSIIARNIFYNYGRLGLAAPNAVGLTLEASVGANSKNNQIIDNVFDGNNNGNTIGINSPQTEVTNLFEQNVFKRNAGYSFYNANGIIRLNNGFVTEKQGTATLLNGQTSKTVTHGCDYTPNAGDISVHPIESLGSSSYWYVDTITSTQFTIRVDANPGQDVDFAWSVDSH